MSLFLIFMLFSLSELVRKSDVQLQLVREIIQKYFVSTPTNKGVTNHKDL
jgi:hypothetical protein